MAKKTYRYVPQLKETIDSRLESNINDLHGIIKGISSDNIIDENEICCLQKWIDENSKYKNYSVFSRIITELTLILKDEMVSDYEKEILLTLVDGVHSSDIYSDVTLSVQVLEGIIKGIMANNKIEDSEVAFLRSWLSDNDYLQGVYPYDKITTAIERVLEDGIITDEEKEFLMGEFDEILTPVGSGNSVDFNGKTFCLTGDFKTGTKEKIAEKITQKGGIQRSSVSGKLNYLFVGGLGSEAWKYGNIGGKIAKAQELKEKGFGIQIISEDDLISYF